MYNIKVNGKYDYKVEKKGDKLSINDEKIDADIQQYGPSVYHIIHNLGSYNAEVVSFDKEAKTAEIKVNGTVYSIVAKDQFDVLLDKLGLSNLNSAKVSEVKAPMPGLVLKVFVREGSEVKKGDNLFKISQKTGMSLDELKKLNKLTDKSKIQVGQKLKLG